LPHALGPSLVFNEMLRAKKRTSVISLEENVFLRQIHVVENNLDHRLLLATPNSARLFA
jgi:hypothetical protein